MHAVSAFESPVSLTQLAWVMPPNQQVLVHSVEYEHTPTKLRINYRAHQIRRA